MNIFILSHFFKKFINFETWSYVFSHTNKILSILLFYLIKIIYFMHKGSLIGTRNYNILRKLYLYFHAK